MSKLSTDKALIIAEDIQDNVGKMFKNPAKDAALHLLHDAQQLQSNAALSTQVQSYLNIMEQGNLPMITVDDPNGEINSVVPTKKPNVFRVLSANPKGVILDRVRIEKQTPLPAPDRSKLPIVRT